MPKRINKAIELLEQGQPLYAAGARELSYEAGKAMAKTWADYIAIEMEHGAFDMPGLGAFMRGLADAGPTNSDHATPAVIMTLPVDGSSDEVVRANAWMMRQALARGVHGILLCHAETPGAAKAFVESCRYANQTAGTPSARPEALEGPRPSKGHPEALEGPEVHPEPGRRALDRRAGKAIGEGRRGVGGQGEAARIWGIDPYEYMRRADPWPLNPDGELLLGLKIENRRALANANETLAAPGIGFAEWGPGDMGVAFGHLDAHDPPYPPEMDAARVTIAEACKRNNVRFLCSWNEAALTLEQRVQKLLDDGVMIMSGIGEEGASIGRALTNRTMPV